MILSGHPVPIEWETGYDSRTYDGIRARKGTRAVTQAYAWYVGVSNGKSYLFYLRAQRPMESVQPEIWATEFVEHHDCVVSVVSSPILEKPR